jgi:hypothetical protein
VARCGDPLVLLSCRYFLNDEQIQSETKITNGDYNYASEQLEVVQQVSGFVRISSLLGTLHQEPALREVDTTSPGAATIAYKLVDRLARRALVIVARGKYPEGECIHTKVCRHQKSGVRGLRCKLSNMRLTSSHRRVGTRKRQTDAKNSEWEEQMSPTNPNESMMGMTPMEQQEIPPQEAPAMGMQPMEAPPLMGMAPMGE